MRVYFGDALHFTHFGRNFPFEHRSQLHRSVIFATDFELQNLTQCSCQRSQLRSSVPRRYVSRNHGNALGDQLTRPVNVGPFFEDNRYN